MMSDNPYIAGSPVGKTAAFIEREDLARQVIEVLNNPQQNALTLYGQRSFERRHF